MLTLICFYAASSSPVRKRQRLSSPTYEEQVEGLTQEDLAAFDEMEALLSQDFQTSREERSDEEVLGAGLKEAVPLNWGNTLPQSQGPSSSYPSFAPANKMSKPTDDPDNPFTHGVVKTTDEQHLRPSPGFASASRLSLETGHDRSPSPEVPADADYASWFDPVPADLPVTFAIPVFTKASAAPVFAKASAMAGFSKASSSAVIMPSETALAKAKAKLEAWEKEDPEAAAGDENATDFFSSGAQRFDGPVGFQRAYAAHGEHSPVKRPALGTLPNILNTPNTPTPLGFGRPTNGVPSKPITSSIAAQRSAAFKSPLAKSLHTHPTANLPGSPLNPNRPTSSLGFTTASGNPHPLAGTPFTAPRPSTNVPITSAGFATPLRATTPAAAIRTRPAKFVTPFKANMKPGEAGRLNLPQSAAVKTPQKAVIATPPSGPSNWLTRERAPMSFAKKQFFSLSEAIL